MRRREFMNSLRYRSGLAARAHAQQPAKIRAHRVSRPMERVYCSGGFAPFHDTYRADPS